MPNDANEKRGSYPPGRPADADLLRALLDGATDHAIIARALDGRVLSWNEGARRLYGFEASEAIGQDGSLLSCGDDASGPSFCEQCEVAHATGKWEGTLERRRRDGIGVVARITLTAHAGWEGQAGWTEVSREASERPDAREVRTRRALLAKMSHDVRTPLNGIIGLAELLHRGKLGPVPALHHEYLGDILTCARELLTIVNRFSEATRDESEPSLEAFTGGQPREVP